MSTACSTTIDPDNITHTTVRLRKRRMPRQRRRKTHYCYGCEAKVWVHLHSETLVPICHRCLGTFVVALGDGSGSQATPASSAPRTVAASAMPPNLCSQDPYGRASLLERLAHCFPVKRPLSPDLAVARRLDYNDVCPICYDTLLAQHDQPVQLLPCMHSFHRACIEQWLLLYKATCPYCCQETSLSRIQTICNLH